MQPGHWPKDGVREFSRILGRELRTPSTPLWIRKLARRVRGGDQSGSVDRDNEAPERYNSVYRQCGGRTRK